MSEWWETFFSGPWQQAQLQQSTEEGDRNAADKIERATRLQPGSRVLDVACGDGRISLELAARGHQVTGVDLTARFLDEAKRKAAERGLFARFEHGDMRELTFEAEFDAVINFGGSFGYFDDDGNALVVACAHRALRPGGRFLIDTLTAECVFPRFRDRLWYEAGDVLVLAQNWYDHESGRIESDWTIVTGDGTRGPAHSSIRVYAYPELSVLLKASGFEDIEGFDSGALEPFSLGATRLLLVATTGK